LTKRKVLILCTGNSCRSQMAEAIVNAWRGDRWQAFSAGTHPAAEVHPKALQALAEVGLYPVDAHPKQAIEFLGVPFDLVITVCDDAAENCPIWPGQERRMHIGFRDPVEAIGDEDQLMAVFRDVRDDIGRRLIAALDEIDRENH
jgi:arsenate reductase (thioredoxin)